MNNRLLALGMAMTIGLAACGSGAETPAAAPPVDDGEAAAPAEPATPAAPAATIGSSDLGDILVGTGGLSLYGFTNDVDATSTCYGTCAEAWPPVIVSADWTVAPGLDSGIFATTVRDDGELQLVAGKWPLYYFAGDATPGDINGQESGDVWFVVDTAGVLVKGGDEVAAEEPVEEAVEAAAPVTVDTTSIGEVLVDSAGLTLYGFKNDVDGVPSCFDACADAWPPAFVDSAELPAGLDADVFSVADRGDGTFQLAAGVWPLYNFAGDAAPDDVNGQGSGDVWFAAAPDGSLVTGAGETAAPVTTANTSLGDVLVDTDGLTLYGFKNDVDGVPSCFDACADAWPPEVVDSDVLPAGLDPDVFSLVHRDEGIYQLVAGVWPLYNFAGDAAPGDVNGQASGDKWFAAAPDGSLVTGAVASSSAPAEEDAGGYGYGS